MLGLDIGDFSIGTPFGGAIQETGAELQCLSIAGYDATTFGNHDFDDGPSVLAGEVPHTLILGMTGSGKTTTLSLIRSAAESQGYQVEGFAPTSRAARQLGEAGVEARTLQGFLARSTTALPPDQKHFYFVTSRALPAPTKCATFSPASV